MTRTAVVVLCLILAAFAAGAENPASRGPFDQLETTELASPGPHWVWVTDLILRRSQLFDTASGEALASLDSAFGSFARPPFFSSERGEFYVIEAKYKWGHRGERTDFVSVYDSTTMTAKGQIVIPTQSAESAANLAYGAMLDGNRILAIYNQFPIQSVSIVDLEARTFVEEIPTGGCAGVYATGTRSFASLCGDGTVRRVEFDATGNLTKDDASAPFFDAVKDPVMMKGARVGSRWLFVSYSGVVHEVDFGSAPPAIRSWPLLGEDEMRAGWRPGGRQLTALHTDLGLFYVLFHQGEAGSHKDPGPEIWVFDLAKRERIGRFELPNMDAAFMAGMLDMNDGFAGWLLRALIPASGADTLTVTQDESPVLVVRNSGLPLVSVLDARTGAHLRDIHEVGVTGNRLTVPQ